jgi:hypothetical protein
MARRQAVRGGVSAGGGLSSAISRRGRETEGPKGDGGSVANGVALLIKKIINELQD